MTAIPITDLGQARSGGAPDRLAVARRIDAACCEIGLFTITGQGVAENTIADLRRAAQPFFALPFEDKLARFTTRAP